MEPSSGAGHYSRSSAGQGGERWRTRRRRGAAAAALACLCACTRSDPVAGRRPASAGDPAAPAAAALPPDPSPGCGAAPLPVLRAGRETVTAGGDARSYVIDAPASAAGDPRPVVLAFHGFGDDAAGYRSALGLDALSRSAGAIVIHADGHEGVRLLGTVGRGWDIRPSEERDRRFVETILDRLEATRCVDRGRIFATGFSNGGFFASLLGCVLAGRLAAVAAVAGATPLGACIPDPPAAVLLLHGRADRVVAPDGVRAARDWWSARLGCGAAVERDGCRYYAGCRAEVAYCEGPERHQWPPGATTRIWEFFRTHPRPATPPG